MRDFVKALTNDTALADSVPSIITGTAQFPQDTAVNIEYPKHEGFFRIDQNLNARQISGIYTTATTLAEKMTSTDARASALLGQCTDADTCISAFIRKAGRLLMRHPLTQAEVDVYRNAVGRSNSTSSVRKVLATMMSSPSFYFVVERTTPTVGTSCIALTAQEQATRLALHLWDSNPDDALNRDADSGALLNADTYASHVARMVADPRADATIRSFFRQWLRLDELLPLDGKVGNPKFDAFAEGYKPLATSRDSAIKEVLDMISYLAAQNGTLKQVMTDRHSFATTNDIATLYKTNLWDGKSAPPTFAEADRVGLLTRIAFVANGSSDSTLPIQRGSKIMGALTCEALPPPDMDQTNAKADLSGILSTRERVTRITEMAGTKCVLCHKQDLNPWGFVFERFDSLGRVRSMEAVRDDKGAVLGTKSIDTNTVVRLSSLVERSVSSAADAQQYILDSGQFESCFARQYFRFTFGRADTMNDAAAIAAIRDQARSGASLRDLFAMIAKRTEFKTIKGAK